MPMLLSLAVLSLTAAVALWAHAWHPVGLFQITAAASVAGLLVGIARRHFGPGQPPETEAASP